MGQRSEEGGFYWWYGVVEDRMDPSQLGRVRVRILNAHSAYNSDVGRNQLPWANVLMPATSACVIGIGTAPVGLIESSFVFGFFRDGHLCQFPVVLGSWHGMRKQAQDSLLSRTDIGIPEADIGFDIKQHDDSNFGTSNQKNFGDGFKDQRTEEELKKYPKVVSDIKIGDGKTAEGDDRGIQLEEKNQQNYSKSDYSGKTDVNPIAINSDEVLDKTIYKYKSKTLSDGGLLDDGFIFQDMVHEPFLCGITNESKISIIKDTAILSTSTPSIGNKAKPYSETPKITDDAGVVIYNENNKV